MKDKLRVMKEHLVTLKNYISESFWALPLFLIFCSMGLAYCTIQIDRWIDINQILQSSSYLSGSVDGYRQILGTIASSMMTIAGIVFSSTLVALTMAASQFGPRILSNFMRDKLNQFVLGSYIATFTYCLLILRVVRPEKYIDFSPDISVLVSIILAVANIILLIFYIHSTASSIQAENVVTRIGEELVRNLTNDSLGAKYKKYNIENSDSLKDGFYKQTHLQKILHLKRRGYIRFIDIEGLFEYAIQKNIIIKIFKKTGNFIVTGEEFGRVYSYDEQELTEKEVKEILKFVSLGERRSICQDASFIINQILEIALRALSPGINDPHTAISCVDRISETVALLLEEDINTNTMYDDDKNLRLEINLLSFRDIVDSSLGVIRQYAKNSPDVLRHLYNSVNTLIIIGKQQQYSQKKIDILSQELENIANITEENVRLEYDKERIANKKRIL